jgi:hypothetical protein
VSQSLRRRLLAGGFWGQETISGLLKFSSHAEDDTHLSPIIPRMRQRLHPFDQAKEALSYAKLLLKRAIIMRKPESTQIEIGPKA